MTSTSDNENRLTSADRARVTERIRSNLEAQPTHRPIILEAVIAAERVAWHAIGCAACDPSRFRTGRVAAMVTVQVAAANQGRV